MLIFKFLWKCKGCQKATKILKLKNKVNVGLKPLGFKICYKVTIIKTVQHWHKYRRVDEWDRTESQEANPYVYGQVILGQKYQANSMGEKTDFLIKMIRQLDIHIDKN